MWKKILTMSLVLVMVLSFTACAKEAEEEVELPSAQEIVDGVIESLDNIRTYQFDMDMTMDTVGEAEGETREATIVRGYSGTLSLENIEMKMDMTMSVEATGEDGMEMAVVMYLIDDMMYKMIEVPGGDPMWVKSEVSEGDWGKQTRVMSLTESHLELLETAQGEVIGSERVKGVDCYVLELTSDMEQLWQLAIQHSHEILPNIAEEFIQEMFRSTSVKYWIAKDTYFLTKAEIDMAVEVTPEAWGFSEEEGVMTLDIGIIMLAYNYNQPVSIVLPPEAEDAIWMPQE